MKMYRGRVSISAVPAVPQVISSGTELLLLLLPLLPGSGQETRVVVMGMLRVSTFFPQSTIIELQRCGESPSFSFRLLRCFPVSQFHPRWYKMVKQQGMVFPCLAQENLEAVGKMGFDFITHKKTMTCNARVKDWAEHMVETLLVLTPLFPAK